MTDPTVPVDQLPYEAAFAELESLIKVLESNPPALEEALALYERARPSSGAAPPC